MNNSDLLAYAANVHRGIAAAFVGDGLGAHAFTAIQAPHTLTYPFRLHNPTIGNVNKALRLNRAIEAMTNVSPVRITTEQGVILIEVPSPVPVVIPGNKLQGEGLAVPVGMSSRRSIVGVDFETDSHLLIVGATNKGKTVMSRNIVYQLITQHDPSQIQFIVSCFKRKNWKAFTPFARIITDMGETLAMLDWARTLMYQRAKNEVEEPRIFIVLDDCLNLFAIDGVNEIMSELLPLARGCGINFILISQRLAGMDRKVTGNCTARILFNVADTADSGIVGGRADLGAENLGRYPGDCLLICNEGITRVAGAYVSNEDVEKLAENKCWFSTENLSFSTESLKFQDVCDLAKNDEILHTLENGGLRLKFQESRLKGRPKNNDEISLVREVYQQCDYNINATMKRLWGQVSGVYAGYVRECVGHEN